MSLEQMMAELREEYVAALPVKMNDIEKHLAACDSNTLRDDFHKLKGTGKTYGIPEISTLAEVVEKLCLSQGHLVQEFIPQALMMLKQIHELRKGQKSFTIETYEPFLQLKKRLK